MYTVTHRPQVTKSGKTRIRHLASMTSKAKRNRVSHVVSTDYDSSFAYGNHTRTYAVVSGDSRETYTVRQYSQPYRVEGCAETESVNYTCTCDYGKYRPRRVGCVCSHVLTVDLHEKPERVYRSKAQPNAVYIGDDVFAVNTARCKRCNRLLTNADSVARGYGPVCAKAAKV